MNAFVNAVENNQNLTRTENGSLTYKTSANKNVDLFFAIGALRGQDPSRAFNLFEAAFREDEDLAVRNLLYARDIRGGAGERKIFRDLIGYVEKNHAEILTRLLDKVPELGRWDDLLATTTVRGREHAIMMIATALDDRNGLCAKWMPRKGEWAFRLREAFGLTPKQYRKLLVGLTNVVETKMCAKDWASIEYGKIPSLASSRYRKAFARNDAERFTAFHEKVAKGEATVNAGAVYPYDVLKGLTNQYGVPQQTAAERQATLNLWEALPNLVGDRNVIPVVDTSGSMGSSCGGNLTCMQVAISMGLYFASKNKGAFHGLMSNFSDRPTLKKYTGTVLDYISQMNMNDWGGSTNLDATFTQLLQVAKTNNVPQEDMPEMVIIFSDMEFNSGYGYGGGSKTTSQRVVDMYRESGYTVPKIVWWNIQSRQDNNPVRFDASGMALVSGFSPNIAKAVMSADLSAFTPQGIMLKALMVDRYNW